MALTLDSLVTDLMFQASAAIDQKTLIDGLGGQAALESKQLLDVDRLDPRAEMELSPSMPFRRRGERRLMIIDDSVAPIAGSRRHGKGAGSRARAAPTSTSLTAGRSAPRSRSAIDVNSARSSGSAWFSPLTG